MAPEVPPGTPAKWILLLVPRTYSHFPLGFSSLNMSEQRWGVLLV